MTSPSLEIEAIPHPLNATVRVPGSKSQTNRALLIAALAEGETRLTNPVFCDDSLYLAKALQTLGFDVKLRESQCEIIVTGLGGRIPTDKAELYIGNAGTAARFMTAFLTLGRGEYMLDGDPRMRERPLGDLAEALNQLGCRVLPIPPGGDRSRIAINHRSPLVHDQLCPPIKVIANGLRGGKVRISGEISSQFLSALLMVAPCAQQEVEIEVVGELNSRPYVEMTVVMMREFGVEIERDGYGRFSVRPASYRSLPTYQIEYDASAASYFFAAPAVCGGSVEVEGISRASTQGDVGFLDILKQMGCCVSESDTGTLVTAPTELRGVDVDLRDLPDTAQTLAAIAPFASTPTRIRGIASAKLKETDRIHATCTELARLGVSVEEHEDGMTIHPCRRFIPSTVHTYNDHRMAMAFSLIGLRIAGVVIENPACVSKTFPSFFEVLGSLK
jgi:3-phosphoshikimate 1-carboxyvinyltransferase